jgi:hypothetical protein
MNLCRLEDRTEKQGVTIEQDLHTELADIAMENTSAIMERFGQLVLFSVL